MTERTRFHVKSALALNEEYKNIRRGKEKAAWLERQKALSREKDIVSPKSIEFQDYPAERSDYSMKATIPSTSIICTIYRIFVHRKPTGVGRNSQSV